MKKTIRTVAMLIAVLGLMAVGCQKEPDHGIQTIFTEMGDSQRVFYSFDGVVHDTVINNAEEWQSFIDWLFVMAEEGRSVSFGGEETCFGIKQSREIVTYTTSDRRDAELWCDAMKKAGYQVRVDYDKTKGIYTCTAVK